MGVNQEIISILYFVKKSKQERVKELLAYPKKRSRFLATLDHFDDFNDDYVNRLPSDQQTADFIFEKLRKNKAPESCFLISSKKEWDGQETPLRNALDKIIGSGYGTIIICIPGFLGYYEGEEQKDRIILGKNLK